MYYYYYFLKISDEEVHEDDRHSSLSHMNTQKNICLKEQFVIFAALCCLLRHEMRADLSSSDLAGGWSLFLAQKSVNRSLR